MADADIVRLPRGRCAISVTLGCLLILSAGLLAVAPAVAHGNACPPPPGQGDNTAELFVDGREPRKATTFPFRRVTMRTGQVVSVGDVLADCTLPDPRSYT